MANLSGQSVEQASHAVCRCFVPSQVKIRPHVSRGVNFAWEELSGGGRGDKIRVRQFYTAVNLSWGVLLACYAGSPINRRLKRGSFEIVLNNQPNKYGQKEDGFCGCISRTCFAASTQIIDFPPQNTRPQTRLELSGSKRRNWLVPPILLPR